MDVTRTAFGAWNGGRFMNYGQPLSDENWIALARKAYDLGIRTFLTADVYGNGAADDLLARALSGFPRDSYCLVGAIGHDFYQGQRQGPRGYPRFTDPSLRPPKEIAGYLRMAAEKSLQRCRVEKFDLLLLHNPDSLGYGDDRVWAGLERLKDAKLTDRLGLAPGPANGFTLDILLSLERFGPLIDWAMIILNPLEPWPGRLVLPACVKHNIKLITRVVDCGGLFHDDVRPGHKFAPQDHRAFRPAGWVEAGLEKIKPMRDLAARHGLTLLQFACLWNLSQPPIQSVVPTLIQEIDGKPIEEKLQELASLPSLAFNPDEIAQIAQLGDNTGCMRLKGANPSHTTSAEPDKWSLTHDLELVAQKWSINPGQDLRYSHAT